MIANRETESTQKRIMKQKIMVIEYESVVNSYEGIKIW
jgi:hypothetical protein